MFLFIRLGYFSLLVLYFRQCVESTVYCSISCNFYILVTQIQEDKTFILFSGKEKSFIWKRRREQENSEKKRNLEQNSSRKTLVQFLKNKTAFMGSLSNEDFGNSSRPNYSSGLVIPFLILKAIC